MASLCRRAVFQACSRTFSTAPVCGKYRRDQMPDPMDLATGLEKRELLAYQSGNDDPFMMKGIIRGPGTKDQPNEVPSAFNSRIVGCICEEDSTSILWMWLHSGIPRRCKCGHWFKLVKKTPI
ncbi:cytochrome c oxidase subunit 5B, mitochondrial-like [Cotesia glomerata]|uniref:Cytochrome c oxidase subunit 5B, mitochondrial n=1 Tax=Cotesia glomerata TaxID=32391 RepID=A0AAV7HXX3_COTGL|nr:cytochrome c oxidase subunit 5B, mitochondrial-like [Cotesia glomerata]KAH0535527.1 hypothetical protein KQX54_016957 [Cotesia glomerata]